MADHGTWPHAQAHRPEPSWPTVIATTVRLWVDRHRVAGMKVTSRRLLGLLATSVIVVSAAVVGVFLAVQTPSATLHEQANSGSSGNSSLSLSHGFFGDSFGSYSPAGD